jgi:hypothetical protein
MAEIGGQWLKFSLKAENLHPKIPKNTTVCTWTKQVSASFDTLSVNKAGKSW